MCLKKLCCCCCCCCRSDKDKKKQQQGYGPRPVYANDYYRRQGYGYGGPGSVPYKNTYGNNYNRKKMKNRKGKHEKWGEVEMNFPDDHDGGCCGGGDGGDGGGGDGGGGGGDGGGGGGS